MKRHAPAHGIADQYGEPSRNMRHDFAESKERLRLKVQVERLATQDIANRRASAFPMPRKLESKALHTRARKRQGNFIPGGSLLREAVDKHDRGQQGATTHLASDAEARHAFTPKRMPSKSKPRISPETSLATSPPFFRASFATFAVPLSSRCDDSIDCTASLNYFSSMCVGFSERATESKRDGKATPL